jgi:hypothetical protein
VPAGGRADDPDDRYSGYHCDGFLGAICDTSALS